jgi:hypothetical protein
LSWSDHNMLFLACRQQRPAVGVVERHVHSFKNIDLSSLLDMASEVDWNAVRFISDLDSKVDYLYVLLSELIDVFAPGAPSRWEGRILCRESDIGWIGRDSRYSHSHWRGNVNRVKGDRNWLAFADRRRNAKSLLDACRSAFVSINLDPDLPPKKMYSNLRQLGVNR